MWGQIDGKAKIDIVGGDSIFFDRVVNSVSLGKAMDKVADGETVVIGGLIGGYWIVSRARMRAVPAAPSA